MHYELFRNQYAARHDEEHPDPSCHGYLFMEEDDGCKHTHHIAEAHHGVGHAEGEMLDDVHPQHRACTITEAAADELPVGEQPHEVLPRKREVPSLGETVFHQYLPSGEQHAL